MGKLTSVNKQEDSLIKEAKEEGLKIPKGVQNGKWDKNDERLFQALLKKDREDGTKTIYRTKDGTIKDRSGLDDAEGAFKTYMRAWIMATGKTKAEADAEINKAFPRTMREFSSPKGILETMPEMVNEMKKDLPKKP